MKKQFFCILLAAFFALQCNDDDGPPTDPYEGCCGVEPVEFTVGNAKIYLPNAFTPNDDGINDIFFPFINEKVTKIEFLSISTPDLAVMYIATKLDTNTPSVNGWNGKDTDGKKYAGRFIYSVQITDDVGFQKIITGSACSILCDTFATVFKTKTDCFFPVQSDGNGGLDASLPHFEDTCFGN